MDCLTILASWILLNVRFIMFESTSSCLSHLQSHYTGPFPGLSISQKWLATHLKRSLSSQVNIPRVYASESNLFTRWTDPFRLIVHAKETTLKAYKMVWYHENKGILTCVHLVSERLFSYYVNGLSLGLDRRRS